MNYANNIQELTYRGVLTESTKRQIVDSVRIWPVEHISNPFGSAEVRPTAKALANALALARRIKCEGDCTRRIYEIWRGWCCGLEQNRSLATGAVEVMVSCRVEP